VRKKKTAQPGGPRNPTAGAVYPAPAERQRIIRRREELLEKVIRALIEHPDDPSHIGELILRYGPQEVARTMQRIQERSANATFIGDEVMVYRSYRRAFARFGGERSFLDRQEQGDLAYQHADLATRRKFKSLVPRGPSRREQALFDLLLIGVDD
jgi:hypothetical protein